MRNSHSILSHPGRHAAFLALLVFNLVTGILKPPTSFADALDTWINRTSGITYHLNSVTYGGGRFVGVGAPVVGGSATIVTSPDGITWTSSNSGVPNILLGVTYGNGLFVAVGDYDVDGDANGVIVTSPDGINWTKRASGASLTFLNGVTYGNGLFVAVGAGGRVLTSPDGIHWTNKSLDPLILT